MKVIIHRKNRGNFQGRKSGLSGICCCSSKPNESDRNCAPDSNCLLCWLCPHNENGFWKDKLTDPSTLLPEEASNLIQLGLLGEGEETKDGSLSSEMRLLIMGNVWIINQNKACAKHLNQNSPAMEPIARQSHIMD